VGEHRDTAGTPQQLDGTDRVDGVLGDVRRPPVGEPGVEHLAGVGGGAHLDDRLGDVGPSDRRRAGQLLHPVEADLDAEVTEPLDDGAGTDGPLVTQPVQLLREDRVARIDAVAEDVDAEPVELGRELGASTTSSPVPSAAATARSNGAVVSWSVTPSPSRPSSTASATFASIEVVPSDRSLWVWRSKPDTHRHRSRGGRRYCRRSPVGGRQRRPASHVPATSGTPGR
jgi:hypothetical protein